MTIWLYTLGSTLFISLLALIGILALYVRGERLNEVLLPLVGFAAGALLGNVFFELMPELIEARGTLDVTSSVLIVAGIVVFFAIEQAIRRWQAEKGITQTHNHAAHIARVAAREEGVPLLHARSFAVVNLGGDLAHNFIDGLAIGSTFLLDIRLGLATTLAVALHEVPQELGDFAVLVHAGVGRTRALLFNFLTALTAVAGGVVALLIGQASDMLPFFLVPFTAGTFIYLAVGDLIPELHSHGHPRQTRFGIVGLLAGVGLMFLLHSLHHAH